MSDELKPCPFCGGAGGINGYPEMDGSYVWLCGCNNENCNFHAYIRGDAEASVTRIWNTRADDTLRTQLAAMTAERDAANATIERMQQTTLMDTAQLSQYAAALDTIATSTLSLPLCRRLAYNTLKGATK